MTAQEKFGQEVEQTQDDFSLNTAQMVFMVNAENAMQIAEANDDIQFFRDLAASDAYRLLFGDMSIDQAIDRYEVMTGKEI